MLAGPDGSIEPRVRLAAGAILPAALGVAVYAAAALRGLFADGAANLLGMMESGWFIAGWDPPRWTTHVLQEFPAVLAMRWGIDDPEPLGILLGLGMSVVPIAFLVACYFLPPRGSRGFFLLPLFLYLAGSEAAGFAGIAEAPMATAYFWFLLFLILFRGGPVARAAAVLAAIPALWLHEAFALLGPVLTAAAILCLRRDDSSTPVDRAVLGALALWFAAIALYDLYVVYDRVPGARHSFLLATLGGFLLDPDFEEWTLRINVPALLGILAAAAIGLLWYRERNRLVERRALVAFGLVSAILVVGTLWHGALLSPAAQFAARSWGAVMSLPLGALCIGSLLRPRWRAVWERPSTVAVLGILAAAQLGWHIVATGFWSDYVRDFRAVLASHQGLVAWEDAVRALPPGERWVLRRMSWGWTNPAMSFVLAPHGRVASVVATPDESLYQPFNPADPKDLPDGPRFDTTQYRAALLRQQSATSGKPPP